MAVYWAHFFTKLTVSVSHQIREIVATASGGTKCELTDEGLMSKEERMS